MFVGEFPKGLRVGHFNDSLTYKPFVSINDIMAWVECYIKEEEIDSKKKARDVKGPTSRGSYSSQQQLGSYNTLYIKDMETFKCSGGSRYDGTQTQQMV